MIPLALSACFSSQQISPGVVLLGMVCSVLPDLDVVGFIFGVRYGDMFGHRGFSHSISFAVLLAGWLTWWTGYGATVFLFLFVSILSHPLVNAFTDGGLGIAFFSPFSNRRYFFPWRPIAVPPIGIRAFFSRRGWAVFKSELRWIWLPSALLYLAAQGLRGYL